MEGSLNPSLTRDKVQDMFTHTSLQMEMGVSQHHSKM